jgi:NADH:ubiquinone oxidoreductase subunit
MNERGFARDIWSGACRGGRLIAGLWDLRLRMPDAVDFTGQADPPMASPSRFKSPDVSFGSARAMKQFLLKFFTWWSGQTFGTQLWTWRFGELVGNDEQGNRYYRTRGGKIDPTLGFERRWVVYNGYAEASKVPPSWHGWLHHTVDVPPTEENYTPRDWQKPHIPNMTGTPAAYRPSGSTLASGRRPKATGDYQPWTPGS